MKILLDAFVDTNFGDNFFIHIVATKYYKCQFYMIERAGMENSYRLLQEKEKNIFLLTEKEADGFLKEADALWIVGGDLFWDYGDYTDYLKKMHIVKKNHGQIAIMGISLFEEYSEVTKNCMKELFSLADVVVVRDKKSFIQVKQICPDTKAVCSTDMTFTYDVSEIKKVKVEKGCLGISVRKKIPRKTEEKYGQYCYEIAQVIMDYLDQAENHTVSFLNMSMGNFNDEKVADEIMHLCFPEYRPRIKQVSFDGNIDAYILELQKCEKMLCTRFHAMIFAVMLRKPFVPIIYEEKMRRILEEIGYYGESYLYEEKIDSQKLLKAFAKDCCIKKKLKKYEKRKKIFFRYSTGLLIKKKMKNVLYS